MEVYAEYINSHGFTPRLGMGGRKVLDNMPVTQSGSFLESVVVIGVWFHTTVGWERAQVLHDPHATV